MSRTKVLLAVLIVLAIAGGGYTYVQWSEREKAAQALAQETQRRKQVAEEEDRLVAEARGWLDAWSGNNEQLSAIAANLQRVIKANPAHINARIEVARLFIKSGYINNRNYRPGTLQQAEKELRTVLAQEPNSSDALVLLGHVHYLAGRSAQSLQVLEHAEKLSTDNPWLHLNWADALIDLRREDEAEARLKMAQERFTTMKNVPKSAVRAMFEKTASLQIAQRKFDEADKTYQAMIAFDPSHAWTHGNYASFLLFKRGLPDAAIAEVQTALKLMTYGMGRLILAAALYAKWAELKPNSADEAAKYLETAKAYSTHFSWIMPQAAKSVSAGPAIQNMVKELVATGIPLDTKDENDDTGLTLAADLGDTESVAILLKMGSQIEWRDNYGRTPLMIASNKGHVETVKLLVKHGAKVNVVDNGKLTPIALAIVNKDEQMVRLLIASKADVNASAPELSLPVSKNVELTPLMQAAMIGNEAIVRLLLQAGADPTRVITGSKDTAAHFARSNGFAALADMLNQLEQQRTVKRL